MPVTVVQAVEVEGTVVVPTVLVVLATVVDLVRLLKIVVVTVSVTQVGW